MRKQINCTFYTNYFWKGQNRGEMGAMLRNSKVTCMS